MAADSNSIPLLVSHSKSTDDNNHIPSLGSTIESCLSEFNLSQFLQAILSSFAWFFDAQQAFITVFTDTTQPSPSSATPQSGSSIISEWALNPDDPLLTGLPASSFFIGCLVGGIALSTLADTTLGRKNMLFYSCLMMSLSSFLAAFSPNLLVYSCLKFLSGFGRSTIGSSALVLVTEIVGKRWRSKAGIIGFFFFTFGFLSLAPLAYLNRNSSWRNLYIYTSLPTLLYCLIVKCLVHESPRWLLVQGRKEEAVQTLRCIASVSESSLNLAVYIVCETEESSDNTMNIFSAFKVLMQRPWASRRILATILMGFGTGVVFFGLPLGLETLSFDIYSSVTLNALSELLSALIIFTLIDKFNRRSAILVFTIISGIFSLLSSGKTWEKAEIGFELVSFFSACTACDICLLYTTELFPTCVRNSALAMVRLAVVLGGAVSPVLVAAGRKDKFWCYGVFGLVIGVSGVFVVFLPETKGRRLCDSMDEEERLLNSYMLP